ncbi:MAG: hypothetical protein ACFFFH_06110 [Candidatus Thorarchaeota archaeon]
MSHGDQPLTADVSQSPTDDSFGVFLYFFDEVKGHVPLFAYPRELLKNKQEKKIISIHSIWWHQDKFLESEKFISMDLELEGVIYCATLIICQTKRTKRRSGMDSKKWRAERFVLIVKAPSAVSFIAQEILHELKTRIKGSIGENLCFLVENHLRMEEKSEIGEFLKKKANDIEYQLISLCISLIPKMPIAKLGVAFEMSQQGGEITTTNIIDQEPPAYKKPILRFSIPMGKKHEISKPKPEITLTPEPKRVKIIEVTRSDDDKLVQVVVRNNSSDVIFNALLKIYESQGFFGKDILVSKIEKWSPNKDVTIKFEPANTGGNIYFLKVEDEKETIKVKRILG